MITQQIIMPNIKTILVTGSNGQLGESFKSIAQAYPQYQFFFSHRKELDLSNPAKITDFFQQHQFDLMINCAAYTAVDKAESEPELAEQLNHLAVKQLAEIAKQKNTKLIHISTDYVFNGLNYKPYTEAVGVEPQGVYGLTKLKGEKAVLKELDNNAIIIRTSWVYSEFAHNFVKTMLKLGQERDELNVIFDQVGTPTYAHDLASTIMTIVQSKVFNQTQFKSELYHYSNEGVCSWYDFAKAIFETENIQCKISAIETKDYPTPAKRPHYSLLNKSKIKQAYKIDIPYWRDSLIVCLKKINKKN